MHKLAFCRRGNNGSRCKLPFVSTTLPSLERVWPPSREGLLREGQVPVAQLLEEAEVCELVHVVDPLGERRAAPLHVLGEERRLGVEAPGDDLRRAHWK